MGSSLSECLYYLSINPVKLVENWVKMRLFEGVDSEGFGLVMLLTLCPLFSKVDQS